MRCEVLPDREPGGRIAVFFGANGDEVNERVHAAFPDVRIFADVPSRIEQGIRISVLASPVKQVVHIGIAPGCRYVRILLLKPFGVKQGVWIATLEIPATQVMPERIPA